MASPPQMSKGPEIPRKVTLARIKERLDDIVGILTFILIILLAIAGWIAYWQLRASGIIK